eukprot:scaffold75_cov217-Pinguiococcus_pyrenoidosus.AAC.1
MGEETWEKGHGRRGPLLFLFSQEQRTNSSAGQQRREEEVVPGAKWLSRPAWPPSGALLGYLGDTTVTANLRLSKYLAL